MAGKKNQYLKPGLLIGILIGAAAIIVAVVLQIVLAPGTVNSSKCNDDRECTADLLTPYGTCRIENFPSDKHCSQCYSAGAGAKCDGLGECSGDPTLCFGYCDSDGDDNCENLFTFNEAYLEDSDITHDTYCSANECTGSFVFPFFAGDNFEYEVSTARCEELLDPAFYAVNKSCLQIERYVMPWDSSDYEWDMQVCIYRWKCGKKDQAWLDDAYGVSATAASKKISATSTLASRLAKKLGFNSSALVPADTLAKATARKTCHDQHQANRTAGLPLNPCNL